MKKVIQGETDLYSQYPHIASYWDNNLNVLDTQHAHCGDTTQNFWWKCENGENHSYQTTIKKRIQNTSCPYCSNKKVLQGFNDFETLYPEIAKEWGNENIKEPSEFLPNYSKKVFWICDKGHHWETSIRNRTLRGVNCHYCSGHKILPGETDLFSLHPELLDYWDSTLNPDIEQNSISPHLKKKIVWKCNKNSNHTWIRTPIRMITGTGRCPHCVEEMKRENNSYLIDSHPEIAQQFSFKNDFPLQHVLKNSNQKFIWKCKQGHEWEATVQARTSRNSKCPFCSNKRVVKGVNDFATLYPEIAKEWHPSKNSKRPYEIKSKSHFKAVWKCVKCNHEWKTAVYHRTGNDSGCPQCSGRVVNAGINDIATLHPDVIQYWSDKNTYSPSEVSSGSGKTVIWKCKQGHEWEMSPYRQLKSNRVSFCSECHSYNVSQSEKDLRTSIIEILGDKSLLIANDRSIITPYELDIYIPSKSLAIEFNGLYCHTEKYKDKYYHFNKWKMCKENGIQLITIWEDEWNEHPEIVTSMISHKLGLSQQKKYYARNTTIVEISHKEAKSFLNDNHIQGFSNGSLYVGSVNSNKELIAVSIWKKQQDELLLVRYATSEIVVGGMGKHLSYGKSYCKQNGVTRIVTFADHCVSDGSLYETLGFIAEKELSPDYRYLNNNQRQHKFGYRKKRFKNDPNLLYDPLYTEKELAELNGLERIWDCGKTRYVFNVT